MLTMDAAAPSKRFSNVEEDLAAIRESFALGEVAECRYLPAGLMNGNWRLATTAGVFALKRIVDVPLPVARRNLAVLAELADADAPVARPLTTRAGETVQEIEERGYCLIPWAEGDHIAGTTLTMGQATDLGMMLGEIHRHLNSERMSHLLPPAPQQTTARVTAPDMARAEADRFLATIARLDTPTEFDDEAAAALSLRKVLLDKYSHDRPASEVAAGPVGWTHGDVQYRNVLWVDDKVAAVIDWDRIRTRPLGEEVARTATVQFGAESGYLDLGRTAAFVSGYRSVVPLPTASLVDAVERLWWKRMSDYWQLDFHYDRNDHSCDDLFLPAERFLTWWTENRETVHEAFAATP